MITYNVVSYNIVITLLCEKLDREASHITDSVCTTLFTTGSACTEQNGGFLANPVEELGRCEGRNVICNLEFSPSACSFSMNDSVFR